MTAIPFQTSTCAALDAPTRSFLVRLGRSLWRSLEAVGQARAAGVLRQRAAYYASWNPAMAARLLAVASQYEHKR